VLDRVRQVHGLVRDADLLEELAQEAPRGADERPTLEVLRVARLLADEHQLARRTFAEDGLRPELPQLTAAALRRLPASLREHGVHAAAHT
jgi:hypothetical protein